MMNEKTVKRFPKDDYKEVWKPGKCIHPVECVQVLPSVYHPADKPWITLDNKSMDELKAEMAKFTSVALTWKEKDQSSKADCVNPIASIQFLLN